MLIRLCWPECDFWGNQWGAPRLDAVWVECSADEARALVHPRLDTAAVARSEKAGDGAQGPADRDGRPGPGYCFLVAVDLTRIDSHPAFYPWSGMWNGYCPFHKLPERRVATLKAAVSRGGRPRRPWWRFWK